MKQPLKRKVRVWFHCLFHFHRRGVVRWRREHETGLHYKWVCATCAEKQIKIKSELTPRDIEWAKKLIREHPEWEANH